MAAPSPLAAAPAQGRAPEPRVPFRRRARLVAWAKVALPLAALLLLSTLFLVAKGPGREGAAIPFARASEVAGDPRIASPRLAGVAADGTALDLSALSIRPLGAPDAFALDAPRLEAAGPDGASLSVEAAAGALDGPARSLRLEGPVRLRASGGVEAEAPAVTADLRAGRVTAEGPVTARAAGGELTAGGLQASRDGEGRARLVFNGGVRLLYRPGAQPDPSEARP